MSKKKRGQRRLLVFDGHFSKPSVVSVRKMHRYNMKKVVVFGIFDGIHDGHRDLFRQAKKHGDELVVIVGRDSASVQWKGKKPVYSEETRLHLVLKEERVDQAVLGDQEQQTYGVLQGLAPDVICLGYDQDMLKKDLQDWLKREKRSIPCVVLKPYKGSVLHASLLRQKAE